ncbi:MAG: MBL fold metallo-hydrolase [Chloroflexota bacterium]|nr:MAG: MBL fold metallo-hydrolase [Chloroflexota bacterium]
MCQLAAGVYLIDPGLVGRLSVSGVYLVMGERAALVDVGPTKRAVAIPERLRDLGVDAGKLAYIVLTHIHADHAGAAGYLSQLYPEARVVVHQAGARHLIDPSKLIEGTRAVYGDEGEEHYGPIMAVRSERVMAMTGGEVIDLGGGRRLRVIDTPGHSAHHLSFYDEWTRGIFIGDSMGAYQCGLDPVVPGSTPPLFDVFAAVSSLRKMASFAPQRFYYAHGGLRENVDGVPERVVDAILTWAELVRQAMRDDPSPAGVIPLLHARATEQLRSAASACGIAAPTSDDIPLSLAGLMGFFDKFGLDVDLTSLRGANGNG